MTGYSDKLAGLKRRHDVQREISGELPDFARGLTEQDVQSVLAGSERRAEAERTDTEITAKKLEDAKE